MKQQAYNLLDTACALESGIRRLADAITANPPVLTGHRNWKMIDVIYQLMKAHDLVRAASEIMADMHNVLPAIEEAKE